MDTKGKKLGIVHRDMSPPNVLITRHGEVKIADFGLAKANSQLERSEPGIIKGKFSYLSPEAAMGEAVDHRTDIFAIGIMLWEMLAGRRLFLGETDLDTVRQVQAARIPSLSQLNSEVQPELERIVLKSLARDPNQRYLTARDLGRDLSAYLFKLGHPVSSFEIATLVREAMVARESERRQKHKDDKVSIIGSLIDEAMVEFTSLDANVKRDGSVMASKEKAPGGAAPLNLGSFEDVQDWTKDLDVDPGSKDENRPSLPGDSYEAGNLAALEEDAPGVPLNHPQAQQRRQNPAQPSAVRPNVSAPTAPTTPPKSAVSPHAGASRGDGGGSGAFVAIVLLVVAAAGVAGAYFGGLFH
jgi:serine/threonine-protein kinase